MSKRSRAYPWWKSGARIFEGAVAEDEVFEPGKPMSIRELFEDKSWGRDMTVVLDPYFYRAKVIGPFVSAPTTYPINKRKMERHGRNYGFRSYDEEEVEAEGADFGCFPNLHRSTYPELKANVMGPGNAVFTEELLLSMMNKPPYTPPPDPEKQLRHQVAEALGCKLQIARDGRILYWTCGCEESEHIYYGALVRKHGTLTGGIFDYTKSWEHTGPLLEKLRIGVIYLPGTETWMASCEASVPERAPSPLEAVCKLIVKVGLWPSE